MITIHNSMQAQPSGMRLHANRYRQVNLTTYKIIELKNY